MKKINLFTAIAIGTVLFLMFFIKTESKLLRSQHLIEKPALYSPRVADKINIISAQDYSPIKASGQKIKSCCSGASRYMQIKK